MPDEVNKLNAAPGAQKAGVNPLADETDDMFDDPAELEGNDLLSRALRILSEVCDPYWQANNEAMRLQEKHQSITSRALWAATFTVMLAIVQLPLHPHLSETGQILLALLEGSTAAYALFYVLRGIRSAVQKKWLLERHKAERFRFVKYRSLLKLITQTKGDAELSHWRRDALEQAKTIKRTKEEALAQWISEFRRVPKDEQSLESVVSDDDAAAIIDYVKERRVDRQASYFFRKSNRTFKNDWITKFLPPGLFLLSLFIAISHFGLDIFDTAGNWVTKSQEFQLSERYGVLLITLAALLPMLASAIRTHRSANEYGRNTVRFSAMYLNLKESSDLIPDLPNVTTKLRTLWRCEESLETEHLEWLQLMDEAEWYG